MCGDQEKESKLKIYHGSWNRFDSFLENINLPPASPWKTSILLYPSDFGLDLVPRLGQESASRHDERKSFECACVFGVSLRLL